MAFFTVKSDCLIPFIKKMKKQKAMLLKQKIL